MYQRSIFPCTLFPIFLPQPYSPLECYRRTDRENSSPLVPLGISPPLSAWGPTLRRNSTGWQNYGVDGRSNERKNWKPDIKHGFENNVQHFLVLCCHSESHFTKKLIHELSCENNAIAFSGALSQISFLLFRILRHRVSAIQGWSFLLENHWRWWEGKGHALVEACGRVWRWRTALAGCGGSGLHR